MINVDNYILGNELLHEQLSIATEILAEFVMIAPRPLSIARLARYTGHPERKLVKLCRALARAELLQRDAITPTQWTLACEPSAVTLEDVFRVITATPSMHRAPIDYAPHANHIDSESTHDNVSLLLMQATMGIRQSVFAHLRRFSLDSLKLSATGMALSGTQFSR